MPSQSLRIHTGPWCGAVTDRGATIKASVLRNVQQARLIVSRDPELLTGWLGFPALSIWIDPERDYKERIVTCRATGLEPGTRYHYALELDGVVQAARIGSFRTFPPQGERADFRFAFGACSSNFKWSIFMGGMSPEAFVVLPQEPDLLFFVHLGDIYYDIDDLELSGRLDKYDRVMMRPELRPFHLMLPFAYVWDDHDFLGNNAEGGAEGNRAAARLALEAYDLYMPHYEFLPGNDGIYQSFTVGRVLFVLTDARFNRSPRKVEGATGKTMLGTNQKTWLKERLLTGKDYDLIVWGNSVPWVGEPEAKSDYWAGYAAEREEIATFIKTHDIRNLCMLSGDAHMLAIDNGSHSGFGPPDQDGGRGGFPVFHAASLESVASEKGGPYSLGNEDGTEGYGISGRRQYGLCEVRYPRDAAGQITGAPRVHWTGKKAAKNSDRLEEARILMEYDFPANETYYGF